MEGRAPGSDYPVGEEKPVPKQESDARMDGQRADLKRSVPPSASVLVPGSSSDSGSWGCGRAGSSHLGHLTFQSRPLLNPAPCPILFSILRPSLSSASAVELGAVMILI